MARYGMDYGRGGMGRDRGYGAEYRGGARRGFYGEGGWRGSTYGGAGMGYDFDLQNRGRGFQDRGGFEGDRYDRTMRGTGFGGGYGGRETGYGNGMYDREYGQGRQSMARNPGMDSQRVRAAEIMTENPECVTPDTSIADAAKKMKDLNVGIMPVVDSTEGRHLKGVITDRDITIRAVAEGKDGKARVGDCMTSDVDTVNKNDPVRDVLEVMSRDQVRRVPVTDREGRLVGIIAQADLAVEYGGDRPTRERKVEGTLERISEPARPRRSGQRNRSQQPAMQMSGRKNQGGQEQGNG